MLWDIRFLKLARHISMWSKDPSTQVGAVIVAPDRRIVSVGYNGFPRSMPDKTEWLTDRDEKYSRTIHSEINALLQAREPVHGCTLYTWPFLTCDRCFVQVAQAGIVEVVAPPATEEQECRWGEAFARVHKYSQEMDVGVRILDVKVEP